MDAMNTTDAELKKLTEKAEAGDRQATRELRLRKLASTVAGFGSRDHNGRLAGDPFYVGDQPHGEEGDN